jgi:hypothetical protein
MPVPAGTHVPAWVYLAGYSGIDLFLPSIRKVKGGLVHPLASGVDRVGKSACDINANTSPCIKVTQLQLFEIFRRALPCADILEYRARKKLHQTLKGRNPSAQVVGLR